jgi:hypothetical protein
MFAVLADVALMSLLEFDLRYLLSRTSLLELEPGTHI